MKFIESFFKYIDTLNSDVFGRVLLVIIIGLIIALVKKSSTKKLIRSIKLYNVAIRSMFSKNVLPALEEPSHLMLITIVAFIAEEYLRIPGVLGNLFQTIVFSSFIIAIFWGFFSVVEPILLGFKQLRKAFTVAMIEWIVNALKVAIFLIASVTILELWGVRVAPIIAGLGLFGVAVALGAQDLFKNLIAGILILIEKRFGRGDWIYVEGTVEGIVETIGFRSTLLRRVDRSPIYVPNSRLSDSAVINFSGKTHKRIYWRVCIEAKTNIEQLRKIRDQIEQIVLEMSDPLALKSLEAITFVRVETITESSIDIVISCFLASKDPETWSKLKTELSKQIKLIVLNNKSDFSLPKYTMPNDKQIMDKPEIFVPPSN